MSVVACRPRVRRHGSGTWRATCGCGWRVEGPRVQTLNHAGLHVDRLDLVSREREWTLTATRDRPSVMVLYRDGVEYQRVSVEGCMVWTYAAHLPDIVAAIEAGEVADQEMWSCSPETLVGVRAPSAQPSRPYLGEGGSYG